MKCGRSVGTRDGTRIWLNLEICGLICGSLTWVLLLFGSYATSYHVIIPWMGYASNTGKFHLILFNLCTVIAIFSHYRTMTTDPGAVPRKALPLSNDREEIDHEAKRSMQMSGLEKYQKTCKRCRAFKPTRAHHCSICGRCIIKMDHHCPWVNNCVGIGNHKLFIVFLFWVNVVCWYSLILLVGRFTYCWSHSAADKTCFAYNTIMSVIWLFIEALLFALFTSCMMADQLYGAMLNQTQIDRMKNEHHESSIEVNEVFGSPADTRCHLSWIVPFPVKYPTSLKEKLFGYRLRELPRESDDEEGIDEFDGLISASNSSVMLTAPEAASALSTAETDVEAALSSIPAGDIETGEPVTVSGRYDVSSGGSGNGNMRKRAPGPP